MVIQSTRWYRPHSGIEHIVVQSTQWYRAHSGTEHIVVQSTQWYRAHRGTEHTVVHQARDFEVVEDRLGSRCTPTSICLFVYT